VVRRTPLLIHPNGDKDVQDKPNNEQPAEKANNVPRRLAIQRMQRLDLSRRKRPSFPTCFPGARIAFLSHLLLSLLFVAINQLNSKKGGKSKSDEAGSASPLANRSRMRAKKLEATDNPATLVAGF
jgi:hypothetical protein